MSDRDTFMTLPSLVRQALERTGGENGNNVPADPYAVLTVSNVDWLIVRDYLIDLRDLVNKGSLR
jgi:hypothetical protein